MALTQRLEFRQSQSLVMTPQLMQAIKLLQLSNLDLSAFVEEELERNPLLERASDGTEPPVAGEPAPERAEFSDDGPIQLRRWRRRRAFRNGSGAAGDGFEPAQEEWLNRDLGSRTEIEQTLDTGLDNVFSEEPAEAAARTAQDAAPTAYTEWGGGASNDDSYNLEAFVAAEVTLGSSSRRTTGGGLHRAGAAHDRAISDRSGRRGRLSAAGSRAGRRAARRFASRTSKRFSRCCRNSIRPASARET